MKVKIVAAKKTREMTILVILASIVVSLIGSLSIYHFLPMASLGNFPHLLSFKKISVSFCLPVLAVGYISYWQLVQKRPDILLSFITCFWMLVNYFNEKLLLMGMNVHLRPLLFLILVLPSLMMMLYHCITFACNCNVGLNCRFECTQC